MIRPTKNIKVKIKLTGSITGKLNGSTIVVEPELENLEVTPSTEEQVFKPDKCVYGTVTVNAVTIKEHYLVGTNLALVLLDGSILNIDISSYIDGEPTEEKVADIERLIVSYFENKTIKEVEG